MGVMVLDLDQRQAGIGGQFAAVPGRAVIRVPVDHDRLGLVAVQALVQLERLLPGIAGAGVLQVAEVLRQHGLPVAQQAEGVLQLAAEREQGARLLEAARQLQRGGAHSHGRVAAGVAARDRPAPPSRRPG